MAFVKSAESFKSLGSIVSIPLAFFYIIHRLEGKSFTIRNIGPIDYLFNFYNTWMIFVWIDNISNMLCAGVFKIYAEGFWLSAPSIFNNIYVIAIKQFC